MKPELIHSFMLLLILSMPRHTLARFFFPDKLRQNLCESGHLGVRPDICNYPPLYGTCKLTLTRYYYNTFTFMCELFIFSGCSGNRNNFKNKYDCEKFCIPKKDRPEEKPKT
ncbi:kunitz-type protease inhibitor 3 [Phyllostomus hastatus]|uniref:kunitz-type protease inhibitor 3 n=1 Tax=Phyllostomus hastatus TaxID=9423 RepID=UPI001E6807C0|nr:kunitz-type protease inhibitor 3 [Phyllostomus hastatus]